MPAVVTAIVGYLVVTMNRDGSEDFGELPRLYVWSIAIQAAGAQRSCRGLPFARRRSSSLEAEMARRAATASGELRRPLHRERGSFLGVVSLPPSRAEAGPSSSSRLPRKRRGRRFPQAHPLAGPVTHAVACRRAPEVGGRIATARSSLTEARKQNGSSSVIPRPARGSTGSPRAMPAPSASGGLRRGRASWRTAKRRAGRVRRSL